MVNSVIAAWRIKRYVMVKQSFVVGLKIKRTGLFCEPGLALSRSSGMVLTSRLQEKISQLCLVELGFRAKSILSTDAPEFVISTPTLRSEEYGSFRRGLAHASMNCQTCTRAIIAKIRTAHASVHIMLH